MRRTGGRTQAVAGALLALFLLAAVAPAAPPAQAAPEPEPCATLTRVERVGEVCPGSGGVHAVYGPDGTFLGYTHGVDAAPADGEPAVAGASVPPVCKEAASSTYHTKVIYARPTDVPDAYATKSATIRSFVASANGYVYDAAVATGGEASVVVECAGGEVRVHDVALSLTRAQAAQFSNVVADLRDKGFTGIDAKHLVFVDGGSSDICSCGVGHVYVDDRLVRDNHNNGAPGTAPMFAVSWSFSTDWIALHELAHNLGAVQNSAPNTSGDLHCNDGLDVMCYQDGGPTQCTSGFSCPGTCPARVFDCGKNDYFHLDPSSGTYLASHWNLGSSLNRFLTFSMPDTVPPRTTASLVAPAGEPGYYRGTVRVTLHATDPEPYASGVASTSYSVDGGAFQTYASSFDLVAEGPHTLAYRSVDVAGNVEALRETTAFVDRSVPTGSFTTSCSPCAGSVAFQLGAADVGSGLRSAVLAWTYRGVGAPGTFVGPALAVGVVCGALVEPGAASASASCTFARGARPPGVYGFFLEAKDRAGNVVVTPTQFVTLV